jgi:predicted DsbA family dithiol-disulfide isomerase
VKVEIWADVVCPWCYIGKRRFEAALARFEHRDEVDVVWRSFELDPHAESVLAPGSGRDQADMLSEKYGMPRAQAVAAMESTARTAATDGLTLRLLEALPANSFDAHRLVHLAATHGRQAELVERLMRAHFTERRPVGDPATLVGLAVEAGIAAEDAERVLAGDEFTDAVRADEDEARALGISGVPFFVVDRRYGVSGAQPAEQQLAALERAWAEREPVAERAGG